MLERLFTFTSRAVLRYSALRDTARAGLEFVKKYPVEEISRKARFGEDAVYPFNELDEYGKALLGADVYEPGYPRFHTLDRFLLVPPAFTPRRLEKMAELLREPLYIDVDTEAVVGGFKLRLPLTVGSMGSTDVANRVGLELSRGAARAGIALGIGENVATMRGYDRRRDPSQPSFKERLLAYLENVEDGYGGVLIQQSIEDAFDELWNHVYSDVDVEPYIEEGLVGFEIKVGQGAKPGLGGEVKVPRDLALRLKEKYYLPEDPEKVVKDMYERHSAPGTFTERILASMIRLLKNNYPKARVWIKAGPYRDLDRLIGVAGEAGADAVIVDGKEGGTGMSPIVALKDLGLPLVACLRFVKEARERGVPSSLIVSGRLYNGGHIVKALALGADAVSMGRPFIVAVQAAGEEGVVNFVEALRVEVQMLTSALDHYSVAELGPGDVWALDRELAEAFGVRYVYG